MDDALACVLCTVNFHLPNTGPQVGIDKVLVLLDAVPQLDHNALEFHPSLLVYLWMATGVSRDRRCSTDLQSYGTNTAVNVMVRRRDLKCRVRGQEAFHETSRSRHRFG